MDICIFLHIFLHLRFELIPQFLEQVHVCLLGWPADGEAFCLVWFRDHVNMDMIYELMGYSPVILEDIEIRRTCGYCQFLHHGEKLSEVLVRYLDEFGPMEFRNYERMSPAQWLNVEEGQDTVAFKEFETRNVTFHNPTKQTASR